jgi:hypothetical protein
MAYVALYIISNNKVQFEARNLLFYQYGNIPFIWSTPQGIFQVGRYANIDLIRLEFRHFAVARRSAAPGVARNRLLFCGTLRDILEQEEYDGRWTASRKKALEEILSDQAFAAVRLVDIRCYEMACKIELSGGNEEDLLHLQNALTKNDILFGAAHFFQRPNDDGTFETDAYIGRPGEDQKINYAVTARLYQNVTGKSPDSIVPTQAQLDRMFAYREARAR